MTGDADGLLAALDRLGIEITRLSDRLGAWSGRAGRVQMQTRRTVIERLPVTAAELRQDVAVQASAMHRMGCAHGGSPQADLGRVDDRISLLVKRIRLLETDVRLLRDRP